MFLNKNQILFGVLLVLVAVFIYQYNPVREGFHGSTIQNVIHSDHFTLYMDAIAPEQYENKLPGTQGMTKQEFTTHYIRNLHPVDTVSGIRLDWITPLKHATWKADRFLEAQQLQSLVGLPWFFLVSTNGLEKDMPFTLDDTIVMPQTYLAKWMDGKIDEPVFIQTLIHEKIHIFQRKNQAEFHRLYESIYPFASLYFDPLPRKVYEQNMTNPDSNGFWFQYKYQDNSYLPFLTIQDGKPVERALRIGSTESIVLPNIFLGTKVNQATSRYHPNELFASQIAKEIMDGQIQDDRVRLFLQNTGLVYGQRNPGAYTQNPLYY